MQRLPRSGASAGTRSGGYSPRVPDRLLQKRWPWLSAAALVVVSYLASLTISVEGGDPRPVGGARALQ
jgi:hypothetical protein